MVGAASPLGHIEPKAWDEVMAVNVTANWHLIRAMDPLLKRSDAGRAVFITSGAGNRARAYWAPYSVSKAALDVLARTYAAETSATTVRVNLFNPGPTRTRMRALAMPGEDPMTLPTPDDVAEKIVDLCLPSFAETGKLYDFRAGKFLDFMPPGLTADRRPTASRARRQRRQRSTAERRPETAPRAGPSHAPVLWQTRRSA